MTEDAIADWWDESELADRECMFKGKLYALSNTDMEKWWDDLSDELQNIVIKFMEDK